MSHLTNTACCPACQLPLFTVSATLDVCEHCGLARTKNVVSDGFDQNYGAASAAARTQRSAYLRHFIRTDLHSLHLIGSALDIGCADGIFLDLLEKVGWQAFGVEPFPNLRGQDSRISHSPIEAWDGDAQFDLVTMVHSLEHVADPLLVLLKINQLLRPGGALFIAVPNYGGAWAHLSGESWPWLNLREHYYHYTTTALRQLLIRAGFTVISLRTSSREAPPILTEIFTAVGVFRRHYPLKRPIGSLLFRAGTLLRRPTNLIVDLLGGGAELIAVARQSKFL